MGYCIFKREARFRIKKDRFESALHKIKELQGREPITDQSGSHFSFVKPDGFIGATNLEDALTAWRWEPEYSDEGDIIDIEFLGEKHGDEDMLFAAIAACVEKDSYIEMIGEDGQVWRWIFDGTDVYKLPGSVIFGHPAVEHKLILSDLEGWVKFRSRK